MKKLIVLVLVVICALGLISCSRSPCGAPPVISSGEGDPSADSGTPVNENWAGAITDMFTEGGGADFAEVIELELKYPDTMHFTITEETEYLKHDASTGETEAIDKDALQIGQWVEIECKRYPDSGLRSILSIKVIEHTISDIATPNLNLPTLKDLVARYGEKLTWADFAPYYSEDVGSGLCILRYPINMEYCLLIGGDSMELPPMYIRLVSEYNANNYIDVRTDSIDDFINSTQIDDFSYDEALKTYKENDPGVQHSGFINSSRVAIETIRDAIEQAKKECTIEYNTVDVSYDSTAYIWKIVFYTSGTLGGDQTVYMDRFGVTCLIVYGE